MERYRSQVKKISDALNIGIIDDWTGVDSIMPLLQRIQQDGGDVILKLDGHNNPQKPFLVLFIGGPLNEEYVKERAANFDEAIGRALVNYARRCWGFSD
jgi:hypothetical protein